jgi:hypothetical protein
MGKFLLLVAFVAVAFIGGPSSAQQSSRTEAAASQDELLLAAYRKHKHKRGRYRRTDWCSSKSIGCRHCSLTYYGYCQCEYDFPCM